MNFVPARLAWFMFLLGILLWVANILMWGSAGFGPMSVYAGEPAMDAFVRGTGLASSIVTLAVGALIASHLPRNPIGWLLCIIGVGAAFVAALGDYAALSSAWPQVTISALPWMIWLGSWLYAVSSVLEVLVLLLFPDGRLLGRGWRPLLALTLILGIVQAVSFAVRPGPFPNTPLVSNPVGVPQAAALAPWLADTTTKGLDLMFLVASFSLLFRFHRSEGDLRRQLKWVAIAVTLYAIALAATYVTPTEWSPVLGLLHYALISALAASLVVALLRYRLYGLDLVINKALVYGSLAVSVTLLYVALVVGVGTLVGKGREEDLWLSLLATAIVATVFEPVRARLQSLANRLVYGHRSAPYDVLADFSRRVGAALSVDEVLPRIAEVAALGVGATHGQVKVLLPGGGSRMVVWPAGGSSSVDHVVPVLHQGEVLGHIGVAKSPGDPLRRAEERLLVDLAAQAGLAIGNVRLTLQLQAHLDQLAAQAEELRASRQRIVSAQDYERRRLERDLHDGAQQQLIALMMRMRLLKQMIGRDPNRAMETTEELIGQANETLAELRDLARGIFPSILADQGLLAAVCSHVAKCYPTAQLEAEPSVAGARLAPELETAVYFCIREALQNTAKYAPDSPVTVRLSLDDGWLTFSITDEGPGFEFDVKNNGTGLQGMADRVAAVGGILDVQSGNNTGTRVEGRAPLDQAAYHKAGPALTLSHADLSVVALNSDLGRNRPALDSRDRAA